MPLPIRMGGYSVEAEGTLVGQVCNLSGPQRTGYKPVLQERLTPTGRASAAGGRGRPAVRPASGTAVAPDGVCGGAGPRGSDGGRTAQRRPWAVSGRWPRGTGRRRPGDKVSSREGTPGPTP